MARKKTKRRSPDSDKTESSQNAKLNSSKPSSDEKKPKQFLEPNPPKARPVIWITSGILMVAWMIFLLFVALSR